MKRIPITIVNWCFVSHIVLQQACEAFHSSSLIGGAASRAAAKSFLSAGVDHHSSSALSSSTTGSNPELDQLASRLSPSKSVSDGKSLDNDERVNQNFRDNARSNRRKKALNNNRNHSNEAKASVTKPKRQKHRKLSDIINEQRTKSRKSISKLDTKLQDKKKYKNEPWRAGYASSRATQNKIRAVASSKSNSSGNNINRAISVLKTLLNTPPEWCNEKNVVFALTLSAKLLASPSNDSKSSLVQSTQQQQQQRQINEEEKREEFRILLYQTLDVLHDLVKNECLNIRQLANVSWAIAKHYSIDPNILPDSNDTKNTNRDLVYSKNKSLFVLTSEEWNFFENDDDADIVDSNVNRSVNNNSSNEERVLELLDDIVKSLIESIPDAHSEEVELTNQKKTEDVKLIEISMICWAYSTIHPRECPAGWKFPACMGKMDDANTLNNDNEIGIEGYLQSKDTVLFEKWEQSPTETTESQNEKKQPVSIVDQLFDVLARRLIWQKDDTFSMIQELEWKELSTIAWAYAHRGYCQTEDSVKMISQLADEAIHRLEIYGESKEPEAIYTRDVSEIAWALGSLQTDNFIFSDALEDYISVISSKFVAMNEHRPLQKWASADCVQLAVAMAHGRLDNPELLKLIFEEALYSIKDEIKQLPGRNGNKHFQSWELSILLWVQARLYLTKEIGHVFDDFAEVLPRVLLSRMKGSVLHTKQESLKTAFTNTGLGSQEKANLCWSLTVLDKVHSPGAMELVDSIFRDIAQSCANGEQIKLEHAHQLWQSIFLLDFPSDEIVTDQFISFLKSTWDKEKARHKDSSARHKNLSQTLEFMGIPHYNEHDEDIDVAIVLKTESKWLRAASKSEDLPELHSKVAVEFDGPAHFTKSSPNKGSKDPPRALGHTVLKYKLLKKQGWTVVRIPYYEFDRIPFWASMERQRYLQRKLKTHAHIRFSGIDVSEYKAPVPNKVSRFD